MDKKRIANAAVAAGLSLSMVLTSVPVTALATETGTDAQQAEGKAPSYDVKAVIVDSETGEPLSDKEVYLSQGADVVAALNSGFLSVPRTQGDKQLVRLYDDLGTVEIAYDAKTDTFSGSMKANGSVKLYAEYQKVEPEQRAVTVTFKTAEGKDLKQVIMMSGEALNAWGRLDPVKDAIEAETPAGKKFLGWSFVENGTANDVIDNSAVVTGDWVLYPVFVDEAVPAQKRVVTLKFQSGDPIDSNSLEEGENIAWVLNAGAKFNLPKEWNGQVLDYLYTEDGSQITYDAATGTFSGALVVPNYDLVLYAHYTDVEEPVTATTVTFHDSDDSVLSERIYGIGEGLNQFDKADVVAGKVTVPAGKVFVGWAFAETPNDVLPDDYAIMGPVHLYPVFADAEEPVQWAKATFLDEDEKTVLGTADYQVNEPLNFWAVEPAARDGYTFKGYKIQGKDEVVDPKLVTMSADGMTFVAVWERDAEEPIPVMHTVTLIDKANGTEDSYKVKDGEAFAEPTDPTFEGYKFLGWSLNETKKQGFEAYDFSTPVTSDVTLYAWYVADEDTTTPEEPATPEEPGDGTTNEEAATTTPEAKKDAVPNTGDTTNTAAVAGVGLAGVLAAVAGAFFKRRNNE